MAESLNQGPIATVSDYEFIDHANIVGSIYAAGSALGVVLNTLVILTIFRSQRMLRTPKYWIVGVVSTTYWLQSTLSNPQMAATWLEADQKTSCGLWLTAAAFNRYICVGIGCWGSLLINFDYFFCVVSSCYRHRLRAPVTVCSILTCTLILILALAATLSLHASTETPFPAVKCHLSFTDSNMELAEISFRTYVPLAGSILISAVAIMFRSSGVVKDLFRLEQNLEASLGVQGYKSYSVFPPLDHALFLLILILFYLPAAIITHLILWKDILPGPNNPGLIHLATAVAIMRDNAGCLVPLVWFCFDDMRNTFTRVVCLWKKSHSTDSAFEDSSEFRMYESYPYCASAQL